MRWKRRRCCAHTAFLLILLLCVGGLVVLGQWKRPRVNPVTMTDRGVHILKPDSNSSSMKQSKWKYPGVPPIPPMFDVKLSSALDESSQQGLEISLGSNISLSGEIRAKRTLVVEPFKYILNEPEACMQSAPFLVLLIAVEPKQVDARNAIRQTWGNESVAGGLGFVRLFLLGVKDDKGIGSKIQRTIEAESRQHHDIIQQDFQDTYQNLTLKTLMGMYWVATYCPSARYVMKTDSDMFVNTEYLIHKLLKPKEQPRQKYFTGYLMRGYAPNRNKRSKWYMSQELYPSERYPIFCSGTGYVFSGDMAHRIYGASLSIRRLHLEDVYVGICLAKLRIEPVPPPNEFLFNHWRVSYSSCKYSHLITSHQFHPNELLKYWQHLQSNKHNACINMPLKVKDKTSRKLL
ncbi:beta-1,3-galactosyltransferase 2-like [Xyrauchen texanus]|uniref:beta-1,3-galactosyltransferase 2-like n=1 Tax=Xyrauchen texanus TaxID=154827 RepID=UPI002241CD48|nr:beta-1,3-galactosyltransferase 2-like [Xyrauchen texanus]XP_051984422.1 beta-1,3-galactosyltransferase 2-like [Xyrauchen texanus]XP_051984423.1 beta-1,3-galactosyltransferase 2-like [Xyrauchen texanus]XP_051984424.1 beta-1,3-galactosyltransferase 2-like [Xyrauchen texanus]